MVYLLVHLRKPKGLRLERDISSSKYPKIETKKNRLEESVVFSNFRHNCIGNDTMCDIS